MKIRRFNDEGLQRMGSFLDSLTTSEPMTWSEELVKNEFACELEQAPEIEQRTFSDRQEIAEYLNDLLLGSGLDNVERDKGMWAWLALFYFDILCPTDNEGIRKPGERARWIPVIGDFRKYYRHLLAGPFRIYRAHRDHIDDARVLLCTPPHSPGDVAEQLASRQELVTNSAIVQAATLLYVDNDTGSIKRGAAGRGPGSARRLAQVLGQFDITWDLYSMSATDILEFLPAEFDRFS